MAVQTPPSTQVQIYDMIFTVVGYMILGVAGVLSNIFILVIIGKNKSLQSSCFLLICLECVCSIIVAIGHFVLGVTEATQLDPSRAPIRPRWLCYTSTLFLTTLGIQASNLSMCCVAMDRLMSILTPTRYQQAKAKHVRSCWAFCFVYSSGTTIWGLFSEPSGFNSPIKCSVMIPFKLLTRSFMAYRGPFNLAIGVLAVVLYAVVLVTFKFRAKSISDPGAAQTFIKHQKACMPTVKLLMLYYSITAVLPEIYMSTATFIPLVGLYTDRIGCYVGPIKLASSLAQIIALFLGSTKFRICARTAFGYNAGNTVMGPIGVSSGRQVQDQSSTLETM